MGNKSIYIDYDSAKNVVLKDLETLVCVDLTKKVNELADIVASTEKNWQGLNAERSRQGINEIIDAINEFKNECLDKYLVDINTQVEAYRDNEEAG